MVDVLCYDDLDLFGRDLNDPVAELQQDIVHMLLEAIGSNCDAPTRSIALQTYLSGSSNTGLTHLIENQLIADPRIDAAIASLSSTTSDSNGNPIVAISLQIQCDAGNLGITITFDGNGNIVDPGAFTNITVVTS